MYFLHKIVYHTRNLTFTVPEQTIDGLEIAKEQIKEALKVVCESHKLVLAQVWIAHKDKSHVLMSSSLGDTQMNQLLAIKLTGCLYAVAGIALIDFCLYFRMCDVLAREIICGGEFVPKTLQDYESRYISMLRSNKLDYWDSDPFSARSALAICLRSNDTGDFNYAFEFIWIKQPNYVILLEDILLTLKRCLPRFKFASGEELGEELDVIAVETATYSEDDEDNTATDNETGEIGESVKFKIFERKRSSPMLKALEEGNKAVVVDYIAPSKVTCKTTPKALPREVIEKQFGKTMKDAAKSVNGRSSPMPKALDKGKKPMNDKEPPHSEGRGKTTPIELSFEDVEKQFGKSMEKAADALHELGEELDVITVETDTESEDHEDTQPDEDSEDDEDNEQRQIGETKMFKIFQGKGSSPMLKELDKGKKPMVVNDKEPPRLKARGKTTPIELSFEDAEKQFGKSMEKAADALHVSKSTLNRRWKEGLSKEYATKYGTKSEKWPGSRRSKKRKVNDSSVINEINTNEEVHGAIQEPSTDHSIMTIEAQYADDIIKFPLRISEATFGTLEEKIAMKFKLSVGTYKLKYLDEHKRRILLTSNEEMNYCIESSRKSDGRIVVQLSVLPSTQIN